MTRFCLTGRSHIASSRSSQQRPGSTSLPPIKPCSRPPTPFKLQRHEKQKARALKLNAGLDRLRLCAIGLSRAESERGGDCAHATARPTALLSTERVSLRARRPENPRQTRIWGDKTASSFDITRVALNVEGFRSRFCTKCAGLSALACLSFACSSKVVIATWACSQSSDAGRTDSTASEAGDPLEFPWSTGFEDGFCDYLAGGFCFSTGSASYALVSAPVHLEITQRRLRLLRNRTPKPAACGRVRYQPKPTTELGTTFHLSARIMPFGICCTFKGVPGQEQFARAVGHLTHQQR